MIAAIATIAEKFQKLQVFVLFFLEKAIWAIKAT